MNQILVLREKRANLWNQAKAFLDSHRDEDGMVSAEDNATYEKMEADVAALGKEIERLERQAAIDREKDSMSDSVALKSCPFCGGKAIAQQDFAGGLIMCTKCDAFMRNRTGFNVDNIIPKWNRRAEAEAHLYTLDELIQLKPLTAVYLEECDDPEGECHVTEWIGTCRVEVDNYAHVEPYTQILFKNYSEAAEEYGSYWRCWSSRPTEARMRATQWQGVSK